MRPQEFTTSSLVNNKSSEHNVQAVGIGAAQSSAEILIGKNMYVREKTPTLNVD